MADGDRTPGDVVQPGTSGTRGGDDRTPLMSVPEVRQLSDALVANGWGDVVDKTEAHLEIDTTTMKITAMVAYGLPEQQNRNPSPAGDATLGQLTNVDNPTTFVVRNAPNTLDLETSAKVIPRLTTNRLANRWEGPGHEEFVKYMHKLEWAINREGERLRTIGGALYDVAEALEQAQDDAEASFWGAAGIALTSGGIMTSVLTGTGLLGALAGGLVTAASHGEEAADRGSTLANQETDSNVELEHPRYMKQGPRKYLEKFDYSDDPKDWKIDPDR